MRHRRLAPGSPGGGADSRHPLPGRLHRARALWLLLPLACSFSALSQEAKPAAGKVTGEVRVGYTTQSGNTTADTFSGSIAAGFEKGHNSLAFSLRAFQSANSEQRIAESYRASLSDEYRFGGSRHGVYAKISWYRDTFAGVDQRIKPGAGYLVSWIDDPASKTNFKTRLGMQYRRTWDVQGLVSSETVLQVSFLLNWPVRPERLVLKVSADFGGNVERFSDYEFEGVVGLSSNISKRFDFFADYVLLYNSVPVPGYKERDTKLSTGFGVKF